MIRKNQKLFQIACLVVAGILLWPLSFWAGAQKYIPQISPFVAICDSIALRSVGAGTALGLAFAAIGLVQRRWFCRFACPLGLVLDAVAHIGLKKTSWWGRAAPLGRYAALLCIAGAAVGYPFLLWLDPLAIFSSSFALRAGTGVLSGVLSILGVVILLSLSLTSGGLWCARICPLGGTMDLLASIGARLKTGLKPASSRLMPKDVPKPAMAGRRSFIFLAAGAGLGLSGKWLGAARGENAPLRPPGAAEEKDFAGLCLRCSNCVKACPSEIIHHDTGTAGIAGLLAPVIYFRDQYCLEKCNACTQVCPSGAIHILDLRQKRHYVIGEALADLEICALAIGKMDCSACVRACPFQAVAIHWDEDQYIAYPVVDREKCNGCGACEVACPTYESKAIRVWKRVS